MRLLSFEVAGFRNLVTPVRLEKLGEINVIHGDNNLGKSNLLRAIETFALLADVRKDSINETFLPGRGVPFAFNDLFNYKAPLPIALAVELAIEPGELEAAGIPPAHDCSRISIRLKVTRINDGVHVERYSFKFADGTDAANVPVGSADDVFFDRIRELVWARLRGPRRTPYVGVDRKPDRVIDALYDASVSIQRAQGEQWNRFGEAMGAFRDILGDGRFLAVLPRDGSKQADLLFETKTMRVPFRALGSGVQSLVGLFGHLLTCGADVVSVEEPELNLRWKFQERVRDVLHELVGKEGAPSQLFLTSHSGAFESSGYFYLMQPGPKGPTVERRPVSDVPMVVGGIVAEPPADAPRVPTHVSGEGTLRLPHRILQAVGVEQGGGVSFVDKGGGVVEMMSDDTFMKLCGVQGDDT